MMLSWGIVVVLGALLFVKGAAAVECGLGSRGDLSGPMTTPATGQLQDGTSVRIRIRVNGAD